MATESLLLEYLEITAEAAPSLIKAMETNKGPINRPRVECNLVTDPEEIRKILIKQGIDEKYFKK